MSPNIVRGLEEYNRVVPSANVLIVAFSKQLGISFTFINIKIKMCSEPNAFEYGNITFRVLSLRSSRVKFDV